MGTQKVELERAGEKSAVDSSDPVYSYYYQSRYTLRSNGVKGCGKLGNRFRCRAGTSAIAHSNLSKRAQKDSYSNG